MPATAEQLLALLDTPHWKTAGSTSQPIEGPRARATEGSVPVNLTVLDHIAEGRKTLARADRIAAEGTTLALREAEALRHAQLIKTQALIGDNLSVRERTCPACGCWSLMLHRKTNRAVCVNRHCSPVGGPQRSWAMVDLMRARPGKPKGVRRATVRPRDVLDREAIIRFFAGTGHTLSASGLCRLIATYELPTWPVLGKPRALGVSLSDVLTAHAVHQVQQDNHEGADLRVGAPACTGLDALFFEERLSNNPDRVEQAKALCVSCPLRQVCLETALTNSSRYRNGVVGGLTYRERRNLIKARKG
ncbi:MAG: WhiB family transcriptional regulator [Streptomyces sp.]|nr:WhiB family transcriptional regulator [Streptomyces sp.]